MATITTQVFLDMFGNDWSIANVQNANLVSASGSSLVLTYNTYYPTPLTFKYGGSFGGFDDAGMPTTGKITSLEYSDDGEKVFTITGMKMPVATYFGYVETLNTAGFTKALLAGADTITGGMYSDRLYGLGGNDTINGAGGDDIVYGGVGDDILDGGEGYDTLTYEDSTTSVWVNLSLNNAQNTGGLGGGIDTISNFEALTGSKFDDHLIGNSLGNILEGGDGGDFLLGAGGDDQIRGGAGFDIAGYQGNVGVNVSLLNSGWQATGHGLDLLVSIEGLIGSSMGDVLVADNNGNYIEGGAGNDLMYGNDGFDILSYRGSTVGVTVNLGLTTAQVVNSGTGETDTFMGFEYLYGSDYDDVLIGSSRDDGFAGYAGNDDINGAGGQDFVSYLGAGGAVTVSLATTDWQNTGSAGMDRLVNIETVIGSRFNDTLTGGAGDDILGGGPGNDFLDGGGGSDTAYYGADAVTGAVKVSLSVTTAQSTGGGGTDTLINIENLIGSRFNDTLTGNGGANTLYGYGGADKINGGSGDDFIHGDADADEWADRTGAAGNDTLNGGYGNDTLLGGGGDDILDGDQGVDFANYSQASQGIQASLTTGVADGEGHDTLIEIENLWGSEFNDVLEGNAGVNNLVGGYGDDILKGLGGNDLLEAASGNDTVLGGDGADTCYGHAGDDVVEGGIGNDFVSGGSGNDIVRGDDGNDTVQGNWGMDSIYGGLGNDLMNGGDGNDLIDGGEGIDTATYFDAASRVVVDLIDNLPRNTGGSGKDTLISIENLIGSDFNDVLRGSDGVNRLEGGAGADTLVGRGGDDFLLGGEGADTLNGGLGKDTLTGGGGADTFVFAAGDSLNTTSATRDYITDYNSAEGDKIDLSALDGTVTFVSAYTGVAGQALLSASGSNTVLRIDLDGDKLTDFALLISGTVTSSDSGWVL